MADNSTPPEPAAAPAAAPEGTGTGAAAPAAAPAPAPAGDPKIPTDPVARAQYWEQRHAEATAHSTRNEQKNARYRELYGDLEPEAPTPTPSVNGDHLPPHVWTEEKHRDWEIGQQIARVPSLVPHSDEIKNLVRGGLKLEEAKKVVADRHNITLGPVPGPIDMMPMVGGGGGSNAPRSEFTNEQLEAMRKDGVKPEVAKKHAAKAAEILRKAKKQ